MWNVPPSHVSFSFLITWETVVIFKFPWISIWMAVLFGFSVVMPISGNWVWGEHLSQRVQTFKLAISKSSVAYIEKSLIGSRSSMLTWDLTHGLWQLQLASRQISINLNTSMHEWANAKHPPVAVLLEEQQWCQSVGSKKNLSVKEFTGIAPHTRPADKRMYFRVGIPLLLECDDKRASQRHPPLTSLQCNYHL